MSDESSREWLQRKHPRVQLGAPAKGVRKLSGIMLEFAGPLLADECSDEEYRRGIAMAAATWNASFLPDCERAAARDRMLDAVAGEPPASGEADAPGSA